MKIADIKPIILPTKIKQVDEHLYRGTAVFSPIKAYKIKKRGITQIIDLRHENNIFARSFRNLENLYCKLLKIKYVKKSFYTNKKEQLPNKDYFDDLIKQIDSSKKTYIHCHFGKHRTGFAVAMYQKDKGVSKDEIIKQLLNCKWDTTNQRYNLINFLENFL